MRAREEDGGEYRTHEMGCVKEEGRGRGEDDGGTGLVIGETSRIGFALRSYIYQYSALADEE